ncbi:uncharacterized protein LOC113147543 [Cyclospora cayetanensis]|uniref:Uncharacterized protein LOC113147543 n=1 Tax=Cyclospora cayetanensis TaxID=88456 RepID=A0A6P6S331_9EIME|nr:uncharacterized protein LOC113147543 [Cyclospora cayetanensis]
MENFKQVLQAIARSAACREQLQDFPEQCRQPQPISTGILMENYEKNALEPGHRDKMQPFPSSLEDSTLIINKYCNDKHDGKLVCTVDPIKGRTLYATRPFAIGELILEEPPLHAVRLDPSNPTCVKLMELCDKCSFLHPPIWYWCALNSVLVEDDPPVEGLKAITKRQWDLLRILFIPEGTKPSSEAITLVDSMGLRGIVKDIDMEIMIQIWLHNCFEHHRSPEGYAIYFMPSFCSHSCLPNALWCTDNDSNFRLFPRATISAGDEITLTYLSEDDMLRNTSYRRELLDGAKDFNCMCERCASPVDFSRGFRCPGCRKGVIYVHADETGSRNAFRGTLLMDPDEEQPAAVLPRSAKDNMYDCSIPNERGPDSWRQSLAPQQLYPDTARGSAAHMDGMKNSGVSGDIKLYTIWSRLLSEETKLGIFDSSAAGGADASANEGKSCSANGDLLPREKALSEGATVSELGSPAELNQVLHLTSPQVAYRALQIPRTGRCCVCHFTWTEHEKKRALAVEKTMEAAATTVDELGSESVGHSPVMSHSGGSSRSEIPQSLYSDESEDAADAGAYKVLRHLDVQTLLQILKKMWNMLDKHERLVVDSVIRLTFKTHWIAAQWFRFRESNSAASRKLLHLDRLVWQYRNLYPGLTPALAWAIWDVALAVLAVGEGSKLKRSTNFRRYADQCITSSYTESVLILSALFGSDGSFPASITNNYSMVYAECKERIMRRIGPSLKRAATATECSTSYTLAPQNGIHLPKVWPCYISSCADIAITTAADFTLIPGSMILEAYCRICVYCTWATTRHANSSGRCGAKPRADRAWSPGTLNNSWQSPCKCPGKFHAAGMSVPAQAASSLSSIIPK